jgi:hypothetical protein
MIIEKLLISQDHTKNSIWCCDLGAIAGIPIHWQQNNKMRPTFLPDLDFLNPI